VDSQNFLKIELEVGLELNGLLLNYLGSFLLNHPQESIKLRIRQMAVNLFFYTVTSFAVGLDAVLNTVSNCIWACTGKIRMALFPSK